MVPVCGEVEILSMLVCNGASLETADTHGAFPLHYAAQLCGSISDLGVDSVTGLKGMAAASLEKT